MARRLAAALAVLALAGAANAAVAPTRCYTATGTFDSLYAGNVTLSLKIDAMSEAKYVLTFVDACCLANAALFEVQDDGFVPLVSLLPLAHVPTTVPVTNATALDLPLLRPLLSLMGKEVGRQYVPSELWLWERFTDKEVYGDDGVEHGLWALSNAAEAGSLFLGVTQMDDGLAQTDADKDDEKRTTSFMALEETDNCEDMLKGMD